MDYNKFYGGKVFDAYNFLGCHLENRGAVFRVYAPNAESVSIIGEFNDWQDTPMNRIEDGGFFAVYIAGVRAGQMYKYKIYQNDGSCVDHCDPYGYGMELPPASASIVRNLSEYQFHDNAWCDSRGNGKNKAVNIYEIHAGCWKRNNGKYYKYDELAQKLIPYLKEYSYNYVEMLPIMEYPCDDSWGYQPTGFFAPTARYGTAQDFKRMVDLLHENGIGIILDFVVKQFSSEYYALNNFDGTPLYGGTDGRFDYSQGAVRSFLQSAAGYWLKEYHADGLRIGLDKSVDTEFVGQMNRGLKDMYKGIILVGETDSEELYQDSLGFDYFWNKKWTNDTLEYFSKPYGDRSSVKCKTDAGTMLAVSHDDMAHGNGTVIQRIFGEYDAKFAQARLFYAYMTAMPGKKLQFMGNEIAHFREWEAWREQDWNLLDFAKHREFTEYIKALNKLYLEQEALHYDEASYINVLSCILDDGAVCAVRRSAPEGTDLIAVFNFKDKSVKVSLPKGEEKFIKSILDTEWTHFEEDRASQEDGKCVIADNGVYEIELPAFCARYYSCRLEEPSDKDDVQNIKTETEQTETAQPETVQPEKVEGVCKISDNIVPVNGAWYDRAVVYHIYPLGFCGAPEYNEGEKTKGSRVLKVLDQIPHLCEMGINTIYFGPIFGSHWHGYDTTDYYETDTRLGSIEDFKKVFKELKNNGIRIVLDGVFNHVGRDFAPFKDLQEKGQNSQYKDWFCGVNFGARSAAGDSFGYDTWQGNWELVKLNLKNPLVVDYLLGAVKSWVEIFDIDGLRLDAADCIDKDFFRQLKNFTQGLKQDFWLMGEIIHGDYKMWANPEMMHSVTNYECWKGIYSSHNDKNYFEIAHSLKRQFGKGGIYENLRLYNFLDNHDVNRIASLLKQPKDLKNAYTLMFMMPGIPSVYYGSEWGVTGVKTSGREADKPVRQSIDTIMDNKQDLELPKHISELAKLRSTSNAVVYGSFEDVMIRNQQLVFARKYQGEVLFAAFNIAEQTETLSFTYEGKNYTVTLEPHSSRVISR